MALPIQPIPELTGKAARDFLSKAAAAEKNAGTIDFSRQFKAMRNILDKAKL